MWHHVILPLDTNAQQNTSTLDMSNPLSNVRCGYCCPHSEYDCFGQRCAICGACVVAHVTGESTCTQFTPDQSDSMGPMTHRTEELLRKFTTSTPVSEQRGPTYEVISRDTSVHQPRVSPACMKSVYSPDHVRYVKTDSSWAVPQTAFIEGGRLHTGLWDPCGSECGGAGQDLDAFMNNPNRTHVTWRPSITPKFARDLGGIPVASIPGSRTSSNAVLIGNLLTGGGHVMDTGHLGVSLGYNKDAWDRIPSIDTPENIAEAKREWEAGGMLGLGSTYIE